MLQPVYTRQFKRDVKRIEKSGNKDMEKLKTVIRLLIDEKKLNPSYREHNLWGKFKNRRECHIEPDWLLVYKVDKKNKVMIFERTGSHADIFE